MDVVIPGLARIDQSINRASRKNLRVIQLGSDLM